MIGFVYCQLSMWGQFVLCYFTKWTVCFWRTSESRRSAGSWKAERGMQGGKKQPVEPANVHIQLCGEFYFIFVLFEWSVSYDESTRQLSLYAWIKKKVWEYFLFWHFVNLFCLLVRLYSKRACQLSKLATHISMLNLWGGYQTIAARGTKCNETGRAGPNWLAH